MVAADKSERIYLIHWPTQRITCVREGGEWTSATVFNPGSTHLATVCTFQGGGYAAIFTLRAGQLHALHNPLDRTAIQWPMMDFADTFATADFSPDGRFLAIYANSAWIPGGQGELTVYEVDSGHLEWRVLLGQFGANALPGLFVSDLFFTPNGRHLVCGSAVGEIWLFASAGGALQRRIATGTTKPVAALAVDPGHMRIWFAVEGDIGFIRL